MCEIMEVLSCTVETISVEWGEEKHYLGRMGGWRNTISVEPPCCAWGRGLAGSPVAPERSRRDACGAWCFQCNGSEPPGSLQSQNYQSVRYLLGILVIQLQHQDLNLNNLSSAIHIDGKSIVLEWKTMQYRTHREVYCYTHNSYIKTNMQYIKSTLNTIPTGTAEQGG